MTWWLWAILGLILLAAETIIPAGTFLLFFGVAALLNGVVLAIVYIPPAWQWILFGLVGPILAITLRPYIRGNITKAPARTDIDRFAGETAKVLEIIAPGATGKVEFRGTSWQGKNVGNTPLALGEVCLITAIDNLTLSIRKD